MSATVKMPDGSTKELMDGDTLTITPPVWDNGIPPHASLAEALAAFQAELPKLTKDEKAKVRGETKDGRAYDRSYGYADLAQVVETVLPVLGKHGLSVTSKNVFTAEGYMLKVTLLHESGQSDTGDWPLPDPRAPKVGPQDVGSAMTYGRRYLTLALSGAYPGGEDDDGRQAQQSARERWEDARPRTTQAFDQHRRGVNNTDDPAPVSAPPAEPKAPKSHWTDAEVYDYQAKMGVVSLDSAIKAYDWMASKDLHNRYVASPVDAEAQPMTATTVIAVKLAATAQDPESTPGAIDGLRDLANSRGLTKVQVSPTLTLEQALYEARELAEHAAAQEEGTNLHQGGV